MENDNINILEIIQFISICLFILYQNNINTDKIINLDKDSKYYNFLLNIIIYNNITRNNIENNLKNKINKINHDIFLKNNNYFYIFTNNKNLYVYFFQEKKTKKHCIYFNGFNNIYDIKTIFNLIINNITYKNVKSTLNDNGKYYHIIDNKVKEVNNKITLLEIFESLYKKKYINDKENDKINLSINGYSLGGPYSQVFIFLLFEKYKDLNIELYNIESWFVDNEYKYNNLKNNIKIYNIYNNKSIFYFYNNIFQKYNECNYIINNHNNEKKFINNFFFKYLLKNAPYGIIKYTKDHHLLSNILEKIN
jgi:hypothetical protein